MTLLSKLLSAGELHQPSLHSAVSNSINSPQNFIDTFINFCIHWRVSGRWADRCREGQLQIMKQMSWQEYRGLAGEYQADEQAGVARLTWRRRLEGLQESGWGRWRLGQARERPALTAATFSIGSASPCTTRWGMKWEEEPAGPETQRRPGLRVLLLSPPSGTSQVPSTWHSPGPAPNAGKPLHSCEFHPLIPLYPEGVRALGRGYVGPALGNLTPNWASV